MKKKTILLTGTAFAVLVVAVILIMVLLKDDGVKIEFKPVKEALAIEEELEGIDKYSNLVIHDFEVDEVDVSELYNIEVYNNLNYLNNTFVENFDIMSKVIDNFFKEDFDKSYILADFEVPDDDDRLFVKYDEIKEKCVGEIFDVSEITFLFGNNTSNGGYMVQIDEAMINIWFSKNGLGTIHPTSLEPAKVYRYISGKRQGEDVELNLKDGKIKLSEMESKVLEFLNQDFPTEVSDDFDFTIAEARVYDLGDYDGISFKARRTYKGISFEFGSSVSSGIYVDEYGSEHGEVTYVENAAPDTMLGFGQVSETAKTTKTITEIITLESALNLLSKKIGSNSVYDVYGIELTYREYVLPEDKKEDIDEVLKPVWKIITINQNDDKYTIFYVDVVTGDIAERFEYYYE